MRALTIKTKWLCCFLILSLLLQSCTVYKTKPATFNDAITKNIKSVKAIRKNGTREIIKGLKKINGDFFGYTAGFDGKPAVIKLDEKGKPILVKLDEENY